MFWYFLARILEAMFRFLPEERANRWGAAVGRLAGGLGYRRAVVRANLERALGDRLGDKNRAGLRLAVYSHLGMVLAESCRAWASPPEEIREKVRISEEAREKILEAIRRHGGAIGFTLHLGNWEMFGAGLAAHGIPVSATMQPVHNSYLHRWLLERRRKTGMEMIVFNGRVAEPVRQHLAGGRFVTFLNDQDGGPNGVFVEFFGRPASFYRAPLLLARRSRAPLFIGCIVRDPDYKSDFRRHQAFIEPLTWERSGSLEEDLRRLARACAARYEEWIRRWPHQYLWTHRRWKSSP